MKRHALKKVPTTDLVVRKDINFREDYDIPSMIEEIKHAGRILEPIHVKMEDNTVLKGNRRVAAAQQMLQDPKLPSDLKNALEKLEVLYYEGLDTKELTEIVLDHGSQKPLSRVETVNAAWRLQKQMYSETEIIVLLYNQLARFTGNTQKAYEASQLQEGPARTEFLKKWLHGTVGNYILAAGQMGPLVQEQFLLTERKQDRALTDDEKAKVQFETSRDRINKLASAKKKDRESKGWDPIQGGEEFNATIAKFIAEDAGTDTPRARKPTPSDMVKVADSLKSPLANAYRHCAGTLTDAEKGQIDALDTELFRQEAVKSAIRPVVDKIDLNATFKGGELKEVLRIVLAGTGEEMTKYLERFVVTAS